MRWFRLAAISPLTCLLITSVAPTFMKNDRAVAQSRQNLSGIWVSTRTNFTFDNRGCTAGYTGTLIVDGQDISKQGYTFSLTQQGKRLTFNNSIVKYDNGQHTNYTRGVVRGNQVITKSVSSKTFLGGILKISAVGTISDDGNTVTGQVACSYSGGSAKAQGVFTWTRVPSQFRGEREPSP